MNLAIVKTYLPLIFISIIAFFSACTKIVTTDIGTGLIPPVDGVITKDTSFDVITINAGDSLVRPGLGDDHVLGYVNDPIFGKTSTTINVQLLPPSFPFSFLINKDQLILDSVVLALGYTGVWGDSNNIVPLRVFQINNEQQFSADSSYANNFNLQASTELTENNTAALINPLMLKDSFHVFQDSGVNQIRIRLNKSIGTMFLNTFDSNTAYKNDTLFKQNFNGFQITCDPSANPLNNTNELLKINLLSANTKLAIYYRFPDPTIVGKQDTAVRYFTAGDQRLDSLGYHNVSAHSNYITRNRTGADIASHYPEPPGTVSDSLIYIESQPGVFAKIQIPGLSNFRNVIIHRAELLMEQAPDFTNLYNLSDQYLTPPNLFLAAYNSDSLRRFILFNDVFDIFGGGTSADFTNFGTYPKSSFDISTGRYSYAYNFNISRYVQNIITKKDSNYNLILYAPFNDPYLYASALSSAPIGTSLFSTPFNTPACGRIRLKGGSTNTSDIHKMRLHIVYSLL